MQLTELAFAELYHQHAPSLRLYAFDKFGDLCDDALSLAFQQFWDHRAEWDDTRPGFPLTILHTLVWRRGADLYRGVLRNPCCSRNPNVSCISNRWDADCGPSGEEDFDLEASPSTNPDTLSDLLHAVSLLPLPQMQAIQLVYFQGLTTAEAALRLHCPHGTIKARLGYAYSKLRPLLSDGNTNSRSNPH